ncbi:hypothetical protein Lbir_0453 [Legionella birminghamensis]|uniref:Uncharacterized protein n=2 Tax=Legionella birminghamensis TaxID=28083 RepID=A0A378IEB2_9GAMM|nr:hypothetical protein [Legionella birminghamensis]KTC75308.1 hypothetical protein Lbir_0453 [Legionella birminghamensis]STX33075.1 Uncharacterised protein [Legionella birminghamensis]
MVFARSVCLEWLLRNAILINYKKLLVSDIEDEIKPEEGSKKAHPKKNVYLACVLPKGEVGMTEPQPVPFRIKKHDSANHCQYMEALTAGVVYYVKGTIPTVDPTKKGLGNETIMVWQCKEDLDKEEPAREQSTKDKADQNKPGKEVKSLVFLSYPQVIQFQKIFSIQKQKHGFFGSKKVQVDPVKNFLKSKFFLNANTYLPISHKQLPALAEELDKTKLEIACLPVHGQNRREIITPLCADEEQWEMIQVSGKYTLDELSHEIPNTVKSSLEIVDKSRKASSSNSEKINSSLGQTCKKIITRGFDNPKLLVSGKFDEKTNSQTSSSASISMSS